MIEAVLSSTQHPEHGEVTISFPIPRKEYDHTIELLEGLGIGDALEEDCLVAGLDSQYPVLNRLEGTRVNVDELDYLAKRLDSFCKGERDQFLAMAHKLDVSDIEDFINLTFCCQEATVITDFSDLEAVGRAHYMNLHGGCASSEELADLDGHETAVLLIDSGGGKVTPYGVVYDNGMELRQLYNGYSFPAYFYDNCPLVMCAASRQSGERAYLELPASDRQIGRLLLRAGIANLRDAELSVEVDELPQRISDRLHPEREGLDDLNAMCLAIRMLEPKQREKLEAVVCAAQPDYASEVRRLAEELEQFDFIPDIHTAEEYGRYMIRESGRFEYDANLEGFYNYAQYGNEHIKAEGGLFTSRGYVNNRLRPSPKPCCRIGKSFGGKPWHSLPPP